MRCASRAGPTCVDPARDRKAQYRFGGPSCRPWVPALRALTRVGPDTRASRSQLARCRRRGPDQAAQLPRPARRAAGGPPSRAIACRRLPRPQHVLVGAPISRPGSSAAAASTQHRPSGSRAGERPSRAPGAACPHRGPGAEGWQPALQCSVAASSGGAPAGFILDARRECGQAQHGRRAALSWRCSRGVHRASANPILAGDSGCAPRSTHLAPAPFHLRFLARSTSRFRSRGASARPGCPVICIPRTEGRAERREAPILSRFSATPAVGGAARVPPGRARLSTLHRGDFGPGAALPSPALPPENAFSELLAAQVIVPGGRGPEPPEAGGYEPPPRDATPRSALIFFKSLK